jgi:lipase ATG15
VPLFLQFDDGHIERAGPLIAQSQLSEIQRLKDRRPGTIESILASAREQGKVAALSPLLWSIDRVPGPNVTDKATILTLAQMAIDAYAINETSGDWDEIDGGFNRTDDFGWESDGLRGHVYADDGNSTVVIGFKGTSKGWPTISDPFMVY